MPFCIQCGTKLPDNARFCMNCGAAVSVRVTPKASSSSSSSKAGQILIKCTVCGSNDLRPAQRGVMRCAHCGSIFRVDENHRLLSAEEIDAQLTSILIRAEEYADKNDHKNELATLSSAINLAPDNPTLMNRLGRAYRRLGFFNKAIEYYKKVIALNPDEPTAYSNIGTAYLSMDQYADAQPYFEKAIELIQNNPMSATKSDQAAIWGQYAMCIGKLGDLKRAKECLEKARKMHYSEESIKYISERLGLKYR